MRALPRHDSRTVVGPLPQGVRRAAPPASTWDQGGWGRPSALIPPRQRGPKASFCDPHLPWQKGTNENTNGLIRQFFPKGTEFDAVPEEEARRIQDPVNGRPRETLGWRTPAEAMAEVLSGAKSSHSGAMIA